MICQKCRRNSSQEKDVCQECQKANDFSESDDGNSIIEDIVELIDVISDCFDFDD